MGRPVRLKPIIGWIIRGVGFVMILVAIWATLLGVDRSPGWGPARKTLIVTGIILIFSPALGGLSRGMVTAAKRHKTLDGFIRALTSPAAIRGQPNTSPWYGDKSGRGKLAIAAMLFLITSVGYTWLISVGRWVEWPESTNYYHLLADAFRAGQADLLIEPHHLLLELDDPYTYDNRAQIPHLWDASLYRGRYYLYWGPAPALIVMALEPILRAPVGDDLLVWIFGLGTTLWLLAILHKIFRRFFHSLPAWVYLLGGLGIIFVSPLPWMINRPAIYEAAVLSAQFFLLGGMYWLLDQVAPGRAPPSRLFLAGLFWALGVASRASLVTVVLPISILAVLTMLREGFPIDQVKKVGRAIAFSLPLGLGAVSLMAYNYVRFGSLLELGHKYALSSWGMVSEYSRFIASIHNFGPNLYNYFLRPFHTLAIFPYIKARWGLSSVPIFRLFASGSYSTENITGTLFSTPVVIFTAVPLIFLITRTWVNLDKASNDRVSIDPFSDKAIGQLYAVLLSSICLIVVPLLFFHANTMRYTMDYVPLLLISSVVSYWSWLSKVRTRRYAFASLAASILLFSLYGALVGLLLGITGSSARFETYNPELFATLTRLFTW